MHIKGLRVFVNIIEEGTLAKASDKMSLSTPAASRLLGLLEHELGEKLFIRKNSRLIPTAEAEQLYTEAVRVLASFDNLGDAYKEISRGTLRPLRIACHPRLTQTLVIPAISKLLSASPQFRISLDMSNRSDLSTAIAKNLYDIGVGSYPATIADVMQKELCVTNLHVLLPKDHALSDRASLSMEELEPYTYIGLQNEALIRRILSSGRTPHHVVSTVAAASQLVQDGLGFTIADQLVLDENIAADICAIPLSPQRSIKFGVFTCPDLQPHAAQSAFIDCLEQRVLELDL